MQPQEINFLQWKNPTSLSVVAVPTKGSNLQLQSAML
jgi:hypothetical protein